MTRIIFALVALVVLAACDGNPLSSDDTNNVGGGLQPLVSDSADTPESDDIVLGIGLSDDMTMNGMSYENGVLFLENLPFDGEDNRYLQDNVATNGLRRSGSSFRAYRNPKGSNRYFAVFRKTDYSQVAAVGTDSYVGFGWGGVGAERLSGSGHLPKNQEAYVFTGEYAAVRTLYDSSTDSTIQYVTGTIDMEIDTEDFDEFGAVEGVITDRRFFDARGDEIPELAGVDFVSLATARLDKKNWKIESSDATAIATGADGGEASATGKWEAVLTGPNGEEAAGIVFVEGNGPIGIDDKGNLINVNVRESGVFVAER